MTSLREIGAFYKLVVRVEGKREGQERECKLVWCLFSS